MTHPLIARDWDAEKNIDISIENIAPTDKLSVWWSCLNGHSYSVSPYTRLRTNGCKFCNKEINKKNHRSGKIKKGTSKAIADNQKLLSIWNYELNTTSPNEISTSSNVEVSWKCQCGNSWEMSPKAINRRKTEEIRYKCINCVAKEHTEITLNSRRKNTKLLFKDVMPQLEESWDLEKNDIGFDKVFPVANKKYWWKCNYGHSWSASPQNRNLANSGCPECSGSGTSKVEIYILCELRKIFTEVNWRKKINSVELDIFIPEYSIGIEVDGEYWHRNKSEKDRKKSIFFKSKGIDLIRVRSDYLTGTEDHIIIAKGQSNTDGFQIITNEIIEYLRNKIGTERLINYCLNKKQLAAKDYQEMIVRLPAPPVGESLLAVYPNVAKEWDYYKNSPLTPDLFTPKSDQKFWWSCNKNHSWQATIKNRTIRNSNCPHCFDLRRSEETNKRHLDRLGSIAEKYPNLLQYWDYASNNVRNPKNVTAVLTNTYSWICNHQHTFTKLLKSMIKDQSCSVCTSSESALAHKFPALLNEWDYEKNQNLDPLTIRSGSDKRVWWKCVEGHEWNTRIVSRTGEKKTNCPICSKKSGSVKTIKTKLEKRGSLFDNYPLIASKWNFELNGDLSPKLIMSNSHSKFWWHCDCGSNFMHSPNYLVRLFTKNSVYKCKNCK